MDSIGGQTPFSDGHPQLQESSINYFSVVATLILTLMFYFDHRHACKSLDNDLSEAHKVWAWYNERCGGEV